MSEPGNLHERSRLFFQRQPGQVRLLLTLMTTSAAALLILAVVFAVQENGRGVVFCAVFGLLAMLVAWFLFRGIKRSRVNR